VIVTALPCSVAPQDRFALKHCTFSTMTPGLGSQASAAVAAKLMGLAGGVIVSGALQLIVGAVVSTTFTVTKSVSAAKRLSIARKWYVVSPIPCRVVMMGFADGGATSAPVTEPRRQT